MRVVALIACSKKKRDEICQAKFLYDKSSLFKKSYLYAGLLTDEIYILSTKYGLVKDSDILRPYEKNFRRKKEWSEWGKKIQAQIEQAGFDLKDTKFIFLAGDNYYEVIKDVFKTAVERPLRGLKMGNRLSKLNELLKNDSKN